MFHFRMKLDTEEFFAGAGHGGHYCIGCGCRNGKALGQGIDGVAMAHPGDRFPANAFE
jgi:hypothetical protein